MAVSLAAISRRSPWDSHEIVDEQYLRYRVRTNEYIGEKLTALGVPIVRPVGGHAVFVDARRFLPHIPPLAIPRAVAGR
jgi:tryptophanase